MHQSLSAKVVLRSVGLLVLAVSFLTGCGGGDEYAPFNVSGTVTFDGKPVPAGMIYFTPDSKQGNTGAPGHAVIINGAYDTAAEGGKPPQGGKMIVTIEGNDPNASPGDDGGEDNGETVVKTLFPDYTTSTELTEEVSKDKNFDVPAAAAKRKDAPEGGGGGGV